MCVIVYQPEGTELDYDRAKRLWAINPDGGGFAFTNDEGALAGFKSMDFDPFWKAFEQSRLAFPNRDFLVHMRIATHGTVNVDNVHPFRVDEHTVMAHNGVIHGVQDHMTMSDTRIFIRDVLPRLPETWLDDPYIVDMVESWLGWSKLMFLTTNPRLESAVYILNEHKGENIDGMWFSNKQGVNPVQQYSFKNPKTWSQPGRTKGVYEWDGSWDNDEWVPQRRTAPTVIKKAVVPSENQVNFDKYDRKDMHDLLKSVRADMGLTKRIQWQPLAKVWDCWGCDEEVDEDTGNCECWLKHCLDCDEIAAMCDCPGGSSSNLVYYGKETNETSIAYDRTRVEDENIVALS